MPWIYRQEIKTVTVGEPLFITPVSGFVNPAKVILPGEILLTSNFEIQNKGSLQYGVQPVITFMEPLPQGYAPTFTTAIAAGGPGEKSPSQQNNYGQPVLISAGQLLTVSVQVRVAYDSVPGSANVALELRRVAPPQSPVGEKG